MEPNAWRKALIGETGRALPWLEVERGSHMRSCRPGSMIMIAASDSKVKQPEETIIDFNEVKAKRADWTFEEKENSVEEQKQSGDVNAPSNAKCYMCRATGHILSLIHI